MANYTEITPPDMADVAQTIIFKTLWDRLPAKSFVSGLWLRSYVNTPLWQNCFLRILPVKDYGYFRWYFGNIILCTPGEKGLFEQGSEEERIAYALDIEQNSRGKASARWGAVRDMENELKTLYKKKFPGTHGMLVNYSYSLEEQQRIIGRLNKEFWDSFE